MVGTIMEIKEEHIEWAVVDRLRKLLNDTPPKGFEVTHSFALFSAICGWVRQRVGAFSSEREWPSGLDDLRRSMTSQTWELPHDAAYGKARVKLCRNGKYVSIDLSKCNAWEFVVWLRNVMAHGDHRSVRPIHKEPVVGNPFRILTGFRFESDGCYVDLSGNDMRRIGNKLAQVFCCAFSEGRSFEDCAKHVEERAD